MERLSRQELEKKRADGTYLEYVTSVMKDYCLTVQRHEGRQRAWFGTYTVTINRNVAFNFFEHDVAADTGLEPFPVIRSDASRAVSIKVNPHPDDPSAAYSVVAFYTEAKVYGEAVLAMEAILEEYGDLRTLPDAYFEGSALRKLLDERLLRHPAVEAERAGDWPSLFSEPL
jgi:hypothetical protein